MLIECKGCVFSQAPKTELPCIECSRAYKDQYSECHVIDEDKPRKECEDCINMFAMKELSRLKYPTMRGDCKSTLHVNGNIALDIGISAIYHSECKKCPKYPE